MNITKTAHHIAIGARQEAQPSEILFFEADINYTKIYFLNGKKLMVATTIKALEERFKPYDFHRVHRGFLVNMSYVKKFCNTDNCLQMLDNKLIKISRRQVSKYKNKDFY